MLRESEATNGREPAATRASAAGGKPLLIGVGVLLALDLLGGVLAIRTDLNRPRDAWGSGAVLAAPWPMMAAQGALAAVAGGTGRRSTIAAALLATACLVSGISGFFDGQLGRKGLPPQLIAFQLLLVAATLAVGGLAAAHALRAARTGRRS
jgi:hypothetical protein